MLLFDCSLDLYSQDVGVFMLISCILSSLLNHRGLPRKLGPSLSHLEAVVGSTARQSMYLVAVVGSIAHQSVAGPTRGRPDRVAEREPSRRAVISPNKGTAGCRASKESRGLTDVAEGGLLSERLPPSVKRGRVTA